MKKTEGSWISHRLRSSKQKSSVSSNSSSEEGSTSNSQALEKASKKSNQLNCQRILCSSEEVITSAIANLHEIKSTIVLWNTMHRMSCYFI